MADDRVREGQEISQRIREELDRIRESESRVEEALEAVRQSRRRVEVIARELGREEERVRAWVRQELEAGRSSSGSEARPVPDLPAPSVPAAAPVPRPGRPEAGTGWSTWREAPTRPGTPSAGPAFGSEPPTVPVAAAPPVTSPLTLLPSSPTVPAPSDRAPSERPVVSAPKVGPPPKARGKLLGALALGLVAIALVGWFALRGLRESAGEQAVTGDSGSVATVPTPLPAEVVAPVAGPSLAQLPGDPAARQAFYDSLFAARSPLFDPLLTALDEATTDRPVKRAITAWKEGPVDAQDADLIHSALLQHVLRADTDPRIQIDGQVLRNPCRGGSCTALLTLWEKRRVYLGLPAVPSDAATNAAALRQGEAALVLDWMRSANAAGTPAG